MHLLNFDFFINLLICLYVTYVCLELHITPLRRLAERGSCKGQRGARSDAMIHLTNVVISSAAAPGRLWDP